METRLKVDGMHCGACVGRVQRALEGADGVRSAEVSLDAGEAVVQHDEGSADRERLVELVEKAGYGARVT